MGRQNNAQYPMYNVQFVNAIFFLLNLDWSLDTCPEPVEWIDD